MPSLTPPRPPRAPLCTLALFAGLTAGLYAPRTGRWYSPDSFALADLGSRWWSGLGYTTCSARDLYLPLMDATALPSRSFPPLFPGLLGAINLLFDAGVGAGTVLNFLCILGIYAAARLPPFARAPAPLQGCVLLAFMLFNRGFVSEVLGARTLPLATLLLLLSIHTACTLLETPRWRHGALLGALLGLSLLNRFDAALFAGTLPALLLAAPHPTPRRQRLAALGCVVATAALVYLPWGLRNLQAFGSLFASDNAITALAIFPGQDAGGLPYPLAEVSTLRQAPGLWLGQRAHYLAHNLLQATLQPSSACLWPLLLLPLLQRRTPAAVRAHALVTLGCVAAALLSVSLTPYTDLRYFAPATCAVWLALPACLPLGSIAWARRRSVRAAAVAAGVALVGVAVHRFDGAPWGLSVCAAECQQYTDAARAFAPWIDPRQRVASRFPDTLAHYTGWRTVALPYRSPAALSDYETWLRDWAPHYAVVEASDPPLPRSRRVARSPLGLILLRFDGPAGVAVAR